MESNERSFVERFFIYLYKKRRFNYYFMFFMVFSNVIAVIYEEYSFNLLSFFIMLIWGITLLAESFSEKDNQE
ncbi:Uncharacterised protein [Klebsiella pneumoniae]|nr:hypothetical protein KLPP_24330 [Klebsiella pneumoniae subsp. pneumoniae]SBI46305.1 Uncharacterised protein [Klebsiella pneumoniae]SLV31271.1 Uncharacterised protein [Klebsiella pneumoniae]SLV31513.1 Uncharacterised protein [Klebsiella pneumoniae]SLV43368.1 Uncharacterised protein [Klebsiella pneumoniae]